MYTIHFYQISIAIQTIYHGSKYQLICNVSADTQTHIGGHNKYINAGVVAQEKKSDVSASFRIARHQNRPIWTDRADFKVEIHILTSFPWIFQRSQNSAHCQVDQY